MMHTNLPSHLHGLIAAAIIDNQVFNDIHALNLPGQIGHGLGQHIGFVITRDLNDYFHNSTSKDFTMQLNCVKINQTSEHNCCSVPARSPAGEKQSAGAVFTPSARWRGGRMVSG